MKNKEFQKLLNNRAKSNSGFTLTELLVGLIMGTIVIGGLGFGLVNLLRNTQTQTAFSEARNNSSRALDFISDEVKSAASIQNDLTGANINTAAGGFDSTGKTVVFALNIPQVSSSNTLDTDDDSNTTERVVYYLQAETGTNWEGPQVLYRWGPPLNADGSYGNGAWQDEALIDGIDDTVLTSTTCTTPGLISTPANSTGFYACIQDDDQDGIVEDGTTDTNGDGVVDANDSTEDIDGVGIAAQLFLTSGVDIGKTNNDTYTANTQVVARARVAPANNSNLFTSYTMSYKTLGAQYGCNPSNNSTWSMRTDFINDSSNPDNQAGNRNKKWVHDETRQPQPIKIDTTSKLIINSIPVGDGSPDCISKGGDDPSVSPAYANESLSADPNNLDSVYYQDSQGRYTDGQGNLLPSGSDPIFKEDPTLDDDTIEDGSIIHRVSHTVDFDDPTTYNGYSNSNNDVYVGNGLDSRVLFLRPGDLVPEVAGYDADNDALTTDNNQESLRDFLQSKDYLNDDYTVRGSDDLPAGKYIDTNERIVIFEVGQTDTNHPGFDRQDNIFILSSDVFAKDAPD